MAVSDLFLNPLGLIGLLSIIPLIILYIIKPDPRRLKIPTVEFLSQNPDDRGTNPVLDRLRRNILLLLQLLVLILISLALASPYVLVSEGASSGNTVIVVDASASMATQTGTGSRFSKAINEVKQHITGTTSVIVTGGTTRTVLKGGSTDEALAVLNNLRVTDSSGSLRDAVAKATSIADEEDRIVVLSDFVDGSDWRSAVETARAQGYRIVLRQFEEGGQNNVGIVGLSFSGNHVSVSVRNFADSSQTREIGLGNQTQSVSLGPGDIISARFEVPAGKSQVVLSPSDSFETDDRAYIRGYSTRKIDVLLITSDRRDGKAGIRTALSVMGEVKLDVKSPPVGSFSNYDIVVFSDVNLRDILSSTIDAAERTVRNGGSVVIQADEDLVDLSYKYGELLLISPQEVSKGGTVTTVSDSPLTEGINFPPAETYIEGELGEGVPIVNVTDGSPLIAVGKFGQGRVMYYGYIDNSSRFKYNYLYPVFWKRTVYYLSEREPLSSINLKTGNTLSFSSSTQIKTPLGEVTGKKVVMSVSGYYSGGSKTVSANLLSETESNVKPSQVGENPYTRGGPQSGRSKVPRDLTLYVILVALSFIGVELIYMKYRGDI